MFYEIQANGKYIKFKKVTSSPWAEAQLAWKRPFFLAGDVNQCFSPTTTKTMREMT